MKKPHHFFTSCRGQSLIEFALILPLALLIVLGVVEVGTMLLDEHVVTRMSREGSNLISRDTSLEMAAEVMTSMSARPVDFSNGSKVIFTVLKKGATTGTANFDRLVLYQRAEFGNFSGPAPSRVQSSGGAIGGPPDYKAANSDNDAGLRVTGVPANLVTVPGGMVYITEIFTRRLRLTPLDRFGVSVPETLYSIAYF
jgi:TadE-like protein